MSVHEVVESTVRNWSDLPRPRGWPLLGQLPLLKPLRTHLQFEAWARELGTPYRLDLGPGLRASVWNDFNLLQQVSRERPHAFTRGVTLLPVFSEMGINGLFSVEGQAWHAQRRLIMQALSSTHVRGWFGILHDITLRFLRVCERAADAGTVVEMPPWTRSIGRLKVWKHALRGCWVAADIRPVSPVRLNRLRSAAPAQE